MGGGISGLAALWKLKKAGIDRVLLLEVGSSCGGTSVGGKIDGVDFPWGAHYINMPPRGAECIHEVLCDIGVIEGYDANGWPLAESGAILHWPHERLHIDGQWQDGLEPFTGASNSEREEILRFRDSMLRFALQKGRDGKPAFTLPLKYSSQDTSLLHLDGISFSSYLEREGFVSQRLRWYADYACRDDYGSLAHQVSAWAGIHYFACRAYDYRLQHTYPSQTLTWPEGNARLVRGLLDKVDSEQIRTHTLALRVEGRGRELAVASLDLSSAEGQVYRAKSVVYAGKMHTVPFVFPHLQDRQQKTLQAIQYSPWLVASIKLKADSDFIPSHWDNVLYDSPSLGYISVNHQGGQKSEGRVLTYYLPFVKALQQARQELLRADHRKWVEFIVHDLGRANRALVECIERIDLYRWGHGMPRPAPDYIWGKQQRFRDQAIEGSYLASCDRTGLPLFEEAVFSGLLAAEEAMTYLGHTFTSSLGEYAKGG